MDWDAQKARWPHSEHSTFIPSEPHRWHVQTHGSGPTILLLHGAGASTHSWAPLFNDLASTHHVMALDLPGQGFTKLGAPQRCGLDAMAEDIAKLLDKLDAHPQAIIGHSAGSAIAMKLVGFIDPKPTILSINGAFEKFAGIAGILFPAIAKLLSFNPATGFLFSRIADHERRVRKLMESTGSHISEAQLSCYHQLVRDSSHVNAALSMMAQWSLDDMPQTLRNLSTPVHYLVGGKDRAVPMETSQRANAITPNSDLECIPDLGHVMHEENPQMVLEWIRSKI